MIEVIKEGRILKLPYHLRNPKEKLEFECENCDCHFKSDEYRYSIKSYLAPIKNDGILYGRENEYMYKYYEDCPNCSFNTYIIFPVTDYILKELNEF
jgi:Zn finger protein HypA/HybF involved in hydrogenase expression